MMRELILTAIERKELTAFPSDIPEDDLIAFFTLSTIDKERCMNRRGNHNRFGFALLLCAVRYLGYCPDNFIDTPEPITLYLSNQLDIKFSGEQMLEYGKRDHTRTDHLQEIISFIGFDKAQQKDLESLEDWLTERALEHDRPMLLFTLACEYLYKSNIFTSTSWI